MAITKKTKIHVVKAVAKDGKVRYLSHFSQSDYNGIYRVEYADSIDKAIHYGTARRAAEDAELLSSKMMATRKRIREATEGYSFAAVTIEEAM